jgi:hypothetical protein
MLDAMTPTALGCHRRPTRPETIAAAGRDERASATGARLFSIRA